MGAASLSVRPESWHACVILRFEVERTTLSTEFDLILKSPMSPVISSLCPVAPGEPLVLPWPQM